ncbi:MAG: hypothetical protein BWX80_04188 [Candidatus Hydrogenedentes bacterium ADurb.Bin101]|nr:MAG: hypothetical protein BWX80_04188 [Candidatus Hydrogenedentes bacterium ADurb.Bin101]
MRHNLFKTTTRRGHAACAVLTHTHPMAASTSLKRKRTRRTGLRFLFYYNHGAGQSAKRLPYRQFPFQGDCSQTAFYCNGFQPSTYTTPTFAYALNRANAMLLIDQL